MLNCTIKKILKKLPYAYECINCVLKSKTIAKEPIYSKHMKCKFDGPKVMMDGFFEPNETKFFDTLISEFDIFINIGANIGYYSLRALSQNKYTISFEPDMLNASRLMKNVKANNFESNFEFFPIGLSEAPSLLKLYGQSTGASLMKGWAGQTDGTIISVNTIDRILNNRFENEKILMLIDVEGAEYNVLNGGKEFISKLRDQITFVIEVSIDEHFPEEIKINPNLVKTFNFFDSFGFSIITIEEKPQILDKSIFLEIEKNQVNILNTHNFLITKNTIIISSLVSKT